MDPTRALLAAALSLTAIMAGCFGGKGGDKADDPLPSVGDEHTTPYTAPERASLPYNVNGSYSYTLQAGPYGIGAGEGHFIDVELPPTELGATTFSVEGPQVHLGLFLPDVPKGMKVPVIADIGPYYSTSTSSLPQSEGDTIDTERAHRLGGFLIENFVPWGFAVAQVSVFGSGDSNHCFDMFGAAEQAGINAAIEWLGTQDWSSGDVAMIGRSYDGSTPWAAATFGNPHLKTIVPISGLTGLQDLVTHNGTSELRAASFQNVVYGQFEVDGDAGDIQAVCPDAAAAPVWGGGALATGDSVTPVAATYWEERQFFPRVMANYEGSVFFIHGLQDFNVDPYMITPHFQQLRDKGLDVKGMFGQWGHMYPDRPGEHANLDAFPFTVRYDWAEDLLEWFTFYLKHEGPQPVLKVEVQDDIGRWRLEDTFPPLDAFATPLAIPGDVADIGPGQPAATYELGVMSATTPTLLSGHMYLDASVTPSGADGQLFFEVVDLDNDSRSLAWGTLGLRHRGAETPVPLVPQQTIIARVQSQPFDFVVPAGHRLQLSVAQSGADMLPLPSAAPVKFDPAASQLTFPVIQRDASAYFMPPAWNGTANATPPQP